MMAAWLFLHTCMADDKVSTADVLRDGVFETEGLQCEIWTALWSGEN